MKILNLSSSNKMCKGIFLRFCFVLFCCLSFVVVFSNSYIGMTMCAVRCTQNRTLYCIRLRCRKPTVCMLPSTHRKIPITRINIVLLCIFLLNIPFHFRQHSNALLSFRIFDKRFIDWGHFSWDTVNYSGVAWHTIYKYQWLIFNKARHLYCSGIISYGQIDEMLLFKYVCNTQAIRLDQIWIFVQFSNLFLGSQYINWTSYRLVRAWHCQKWHDHRRLTCIW